MMPYVALPFIFKCLLHRRAPSWFDGEDIRYLITYAMAICGALTYE